MHLNRILPVILLVASLTACNRDQPSGVPDTPAGAPIAEQAPAPVVQPEPPAPPAMTEAMPDRDGDLPELAQSGFPDCDDYLNRYRECLNTRAFGQDRIDRGEYLFSLHNTTMNDVRTGVDPNRIAAKCRKNRALAIKRVEALGCEF